MSQVIYLTEEQYALLQKAAAERGQTPEETLSGLLQSLTPAERDVTSEELDDDQLEAEYGPLLHASGILTEEVVPGWYDRHDDAVVDDAMDAHDN